MATYNCSNSTNGAYGAGDYGTCAGTAQAIGAPNAGSFQQFISSGSFTIILPLGAAIIVVIIATLIIKLRKKTAN